MKLSRRPSVNVDEDNPYWLSFSDVLSGLLVLFILASLTLILELTKTKEEVNEALLEIQQAEKARFNIINQIQQELQKDGILVEVIENYTVLRIPEKQLAFATNSDKIPVDPQTQAAVKQIGTAIHRAILEHNGSKYLDTVFVEGHTDSRATRLYKGNWGLSAFRAISLWEFWNSELDLLPAFYDMKNESGKALFSVSGYAATRRANVIESTDEEREQNRRIDIRFTVKKPNSFELEDISEKL
ncbi:OmpA/MotB family protein [Vibrio jasicida]|uniref:OmpA/MotB family protein n=1 Tax=Vibrio jasicida TaxID=766224 RepID=UPI000CE2BF93|nr:OmpA family protein [Vibrio jasicida]